MNEFFDASTSNHRKREIGMLYTLLSQNGLTAGDYLPIKYLILFMLPARVRLF